MDRTAHALLVEQASASEPHWWSSRRAPASRTGGRAGERQRAVVETPYVDE
ncbi:MAG: hypothetical protein KJ938_02495 [Actinobacteria bacterium]|nr:hypothetical protein [Actinomycetota bacterium]